MYGWHEGGGRADKLYSFNYSLMMAKLQEPQKPMEIGGLVGVPLDLWTKEPYIIHELKDHGLILGRPQNFKAPLTRYQHNFTSSYPSRPPAPHLIYLIEYDNIVVIDPFILHNILILPSSESQRATPKVGH
jgi:hypothetical protein